MPAWRSDTQTWVVRPTFMRHRSLLRQLDLALMQCGADAQSFCDELIQEWREAWGYDETRWQALDAHAGQIPAMDRWRIAILRALLFQPQHVSFDCDEHAQERADLAVEIARLRVRYPLRTFEWKRVAV